MVGRESAKLGVSVVVVQLYGDMLRYNLPFTKGVTLKGNTYSDLTCVPLPDVETRNNPNFKS